MKSFARFLKFLLLMAVVMAAFIFSMRNSTPVGLWLVYEFEPRPVSLWIMLAFAGGGLCGMLLGFGVWRKIRMNSQRQRLEVQLQQCRRDLASLQMQPDSSDRQRVP